MLDKRNRALDINGNTVNGATADIAITVRGSDWYWTVCAIMTVATIGFLALSFKQPRTHRIFHYITASITLVAAIAYFTMASNLGFTPIEVQYVRSDSRVAGIYREIFYVRYIDWFITTPLLLLDLLLTAGMPMPTILFIILVDEVMIVTGLVGALVRSSYKWGYFTFACAALVYISYHLAFESRVHANKLGAWPGKTFLYCGSLTLAIWLLYPIAWGVSEGGNIIAPDSEAIFYGILDILAKPVFGALLIWGHSHIDPASLGLRVRDYDEDPAVHGNTVGHHEKSVPVGAGAAAAAGAGTAATHETHHTNGHHTSGNHINGTNPPTTATHHHAGNTTTTTGTGVGTTGHHHGTGTGPGVGTHDTPGTGHYDTTTPTTTIGGGHHTGVGHHAGVTNGAVASRPQETV